MSEAIENYAMPITCDKCGHTAKKPIKWLRKNTLLRCGGCRYDIDLESEKVMAEVDNFENRLREIHRSTWDIKNRFKT